MNIQRVCIFGQTLYVVDEVQGRKSALTPKDWFDEKGNLHKQTPVMQVVHWGLWWWIEILTRVRCNMFQVRG